MSTVISHIRLFQESHTKCAQATRLLHEQSASNMPSRHVLVVAIISLSVPQQLIKLPVLCPQASASPWSMVT